MGAGGGADAVGAAEADAEADSAGEALTKAGGALAETAAETLFAGADGVPAEDAAVGSTPA
ncbi:MAG: DUF4349 domain-containing protein, partial [Myxococcota bacterium]